MSNVLLHFESHTIGRYAPLSDACLVVLLEQGDARADRALLSEIAASSQSEPCTIFFDVGEGARAASAFYYLRLHSSHQLAYLQHGLMVPPSSFAARMKGSAQARLVKESSWIRARYGAGFGGLPFDKFTLLNSASAEYLRSKYRSADIEVNPDLLLPLWESKDCPDRFDAVFLMQDLTRLGLSASVAEREYGVIRRELQKLACELGWRVAVKSHPKVAGRKLISDQVNLIEGLAMQEVFGPTTIALGWVSTGLIEAERNQRDFISLRPTLGELREHQAFTEVCDPRQLVEWCASTRRSKLAYGYEIS